MKVTANLTFDTVRFDQETDAHLVLSLTAPTVDTDKIRPRLAIIMCIDISGSMEGQKLEYAKQSAYKMLEHCQPDDILGVVAFGSQVKVIAKPARVGSDKDKIRKLVTGLRIEGMTNFAGGMIKSIELLKELDIGSDYIHRVIMLTDGVANVGPAKTPTEIIKLLQANAEHITCSAFGYGVADDRQGFNPDFLADFSKEGKGNYAHIENPDNALKAFGTELGGLISTYATDIRIELKPLAGHSIDSVVSDVDVDEENTGEVYVNIPDLLAEETRNIVVAVKLAKQKTHGPRSVNVFDVQTTYQTFDSQGKRESHSEAARCKVQFVKSGDEDKKPKADLDAIVGLAQLVRAQLESEAQAKKGDYVKAASVMRAMSADFGDRGLAHLSAASDKIGSYVGNSMSYGSNHGYLRSFASGATRGLGVASYSASSAEDLSTLGVQMSTSSTTSTANAFAGSVVESSALPLSTADGTVAVAPWVPGGTQLGTITGGTHLGGLGGSLNIFPPRGSTLDPSPGGMNLDPLHGLTIDPSASVPDHEANADDGKKPKKVRGLRVKSEKKSLSQSKKSW